MREGKMTKEIQLLNQRRGRLVLKPAKLGRATHEEFFRIIRTVNFIPEDKLISKEKVEGILIDKSRGVRNVDVEIVYE
jgi:hypothetical protein